MQQKRRWILFIGVMFTGTLSTQLMAEGLEQFLPDGAGAWEPAGNDRIFNSETLYDYIDGGAELYLSYGFREVISRRYEAAGKPFIQVEIFDMMEPRNAFGIYTQTREQDQAEFGQGSQVLPGAILFWKGKYYISLVSEYETPESEKALRTIAAAIDRAIGETGKLPAVVEDMPRRELVPGSLIYFRHYIWANNYFYIGDGNIFGIEHDTDCCLGRYGTTGNRYFVLLMEFPSAERARQAFTNYWEERAGEPEPLVEEENGKWHAGQQEGNRVLMVFNAPDRETALSVPLQLFRKNE